MGVDIDRQLIQLLLIQHCDGLSLEKTHLIRARLDARTEFKINYATLRKLRLNGPIQPCYFSVRTSTSLKRT